MNYLDLIIAIVYMYQIIILHSITLYDYCVNLKKKSETKLIVNVKLKQKRRDELTLSSSLVARPGCPRGSMLLL
jgi:hypothetical protein